MRVVSKFQDFYDGCLAYGHDETVVYVRNTTEYSFSDKDAKQHPQIIRDLYDLFKKLRSKDADQAFADHSWRRWYSRYETITGFQTKTHNFTFSTFGVLFCGKYYPGVRCERAPKGQMTKDATFWFYKPEEIIAFMAEHGVDAEKKTLGKYTKRTTADVVRDFFVVKQPDVDWLIEHKVTSIVFDARDGNIIVNPCLKNYEFFRAVDHYTAFQELDMWISGTLAWPQNMMIEIDDKYRIIAHGFDEKYGFRKRPQ